MVIGDVTIGAESSVWPQAVLRGDYGTITIGSGTSIQDGTVIHAGPGFPTIIGDGCVVGHLTHLEGCTLEDDSLAGSGSVVLHWAVVSQGATVGRQRGGPEQHGRATRRPGPRGPGQDPRGALRRRDDPHLGGRVRRQREALRESLRRVD